MKDTNNQGKSFQERLAEAEERRKNATISDIIAAKRREADSIEASARGSFKAGEDWDERPFTESDLESALDLAETKRKEADRLEAAWKREKTAIEADALTVGGIVEAERKRERGDAAKLREAVEKIRVIAKTFMDATQMRRATDSARIDIGDIKYLADAALAAPPRNCDVGTVEEQTKRKFEFCQKQGSCGNCSLNRGQSITPCVLAWAQMPYEEGGAK